jgi:hypothetical protein
MAATPFPWKFFRAGGFDQVRLETGADIANLEQLDQKLWVALACPTTGIDFDPRTLALVDADGDQRIRPNELLAAVAWIRDVLVSLDDLPKRSATLPLASISDTTTEGKRVKASAKQILQNLGKADASSISVADTADTAKIFAATRFNGDGIVPADSAEDAETRELIGQIIAAFGGVADRSGKPGVDKATVDAFEAEAKALTDWWQKVESNPAIAPLGDASAAAADALLAVGDKVEDYFTRCRLAAFDPRSAEHLARSVDEWKAIAPRSLTSADATIKDFPLSRIEAGRPLALAEGINPAWADAIATFRQKVVLPVLGERSRLTAEEWNDLRSRFAAYAAWRAAKAGARVEALGLERVRAVLSSGLLGGVRALIATDELLRPEADAIVAVERAVRYHRDLHALLENFVTFRDFYTRKGKATFQAGTLYLDGRACDLCLQVDDMAKHGALAGLSQAYLAYCECVRKATGEKKTIVAAFTGGDSDFLMAGRNGIFYDRSGKDWDATITKVIDNPISVRQAFWSPYKRIAKMVSDQIEKFASSRDKDMQDKAAGNIASKAPPDPAAPPAPAPDAKKDAFDVAKFAGIFAAIGLALGAIGGALAAVLTGFLGLRIWQMPLALGGVLLLISGPSMLLAWLKLRQRNLGPLLDASGWAINTRARINIPFGASLTAVATVPATARVAIPDPFADKKKPVWLYITIAVIVVGLALAWDFGLKKYLGL